MNRNRGLAYRYDGTLYKSFRLPGNKYMAIINPNLIALRQDIWNRMDANCSKIEFMDNNGKNAIKYRSNSYPIAREKMENYGPDTSPLWKNKDKIYYLEYGTDTIFRISSTSLIPERVLTGKLKLSLEGHYKKSIGNKLKIATPIMRYNSGVYESGQYMIFRLSNDKERFFMVYNKSTGTLHRTNHRNAPKPSIGPTREGPTRHDNFIDDVISGLSFNPEYQSDGKAIAFIPASDICEKKQEILSYIDKNPSEKSKKLRRIIEKMTEEDNSLMMMVRFK